MNEIDFVWEVGTTSKPNDTLWKQRLKELKAYKKKNGDCLVPCNYEQNRKLGIWVKHQRQFYKKWVNGVHSKITQERIDQLNEIGFAWEVGTGNGKRSKPPGKGPRKRQRRKQSGAFRS